MSDETKSKADLLRGAGRWLMETWLSDHCTPQEQSERIPEHHCGFVHAPDGGACDFHEQWFGVAQHLGLLDEWAAADAADGAPHSDRTEEGT